MQPLFTRQWVLSATPRARLLIVHGYAEHCGRYDTLASALNAAGIAVYSYDQRGHGKSPGKRGRVSDFSELANDLAAQVDAVAEQAEGAPLFLLGHSMGGLVAVKYLAAREHAVAGCIISSPLLAIPDNVPAWKLRLSGVLGNFAPWLPVDRVDSGSISRDPAAVRAYAADPLVYHGSIRAQTGAQLVAAIRATALLASRITCPLLVLHGTADRLAPFAGGQRLYEAASSPDKECYWDEGGYHELLNDTHRDEALRALMDWLDRHIPDSP